MSQIRVELNESATLKLWHFVLNKNLFFRLQSEIFYRIWENFCREIFKEKLDIQGPWIPGRGLILEVWEGMNMCQIESVNTEWELSSVATPVPELLIPYHNKRDCVPPYITVLGPAGSVGKHGDHFSYLWREKEKRSSSTIHE